MRNDIIFMYESNDGLGRDAEEYQSYEDIGMMMGVSGSSVGRIIREARKDK